MAKMPKLQSLKIRLFIVAISNIVIAVSLAVVVLALLEKDNIGKLPIFSSSFLRFVGLFLAGNLLLDFITIPIVLRPINRLTRELRRGLREGKIRDFDVSRYPELEKLISTALEYVDSAEKERTVALLMKSAADSQAKRIRRDALTGLFNREYLEQYLPDEFTRSRLLRQPIAVAMLDVDDFKHYNDTQGHQEGDRVLRRVADIIMEHTREHDVCIRYGGEEFLIILPRTPLLQAERVAERIRKTVEQESFDNQESQPGRNLTISIGVAAFPQHALDETALIKKADTALYHAKHIGKDRVCAYKPNLNITPEAKT